MCWFESIKQNCPFWIFLSYGGGYFDQSFSVLELFRKSAAVNLQLFGHVSEPQSMGFQKPNDWHNEWQRWQLLCYQRVFVDVNIRLSKNPHVDDVYEWISQIHDTKSIFLEQYQNSI